METVASSNVPTRVRLERRRQAPMRLRRTWIATVAVLALAVVPAALADDRGTAIAIMNAETEVLPLGNALSKCLQASPTKNTPCIRRTSAKLAEAADRHLKLIRRALDGTERPCVRSVATHEMSFLLRWRNAARARCTETNAKGRTGSSRLQSR